MEQEGETYTPSSSRCPSRQSNRSVGSDTDSEEDVEIHIPAKKSKEKETPLVARVGKKKGKQTGATQFLVAFGELQEQAQMRQYECEMQQEVMAFQQKMEQDRVKFEAELLTTLQQQREESSSTTLQQQSSQFHVN